jgi:hypothetical protein
MMGRRLEGSEEISKGMPTRKRFFAFAPHILIPCLVHVLGQCAQPVAVQQRPESFKVPHQNILVPVHGLDGLQVGVAPEQGDHGTDSFGEVVGDGSDTGVLSVTPIGAALDGENDNAADDPANRGDDPANDQTCHFTTCPHIIGHMTLGAFIATVFSTLTTIVWAPKVFGRR